MQTLRLDPSFMPTDLYINPIDDLPMDDIKFNAFTFPSGCERHIKIDPDSVKSTSYKGGVQIVTRFSDKHDVMELLLATDALKSLGLSKIHLVLPFFPYARQDRIMVPGEPLSVKVMANLINSQNYASVSILDPHSDVLPALLDRCQVYLAPRSLFCHLRPGTNRLVSPDAGAYKKISKIQTEYSYNKTMLICNKARNVQSGSLNSFQINDLCITGHSFDIVDDIVDGGGTFEGIAKILKERGAVKVNLIVTHGILSKGVDAMPSIDHVYTTDSVKNHAPHPKLTIVDCLDKIEKDYVSNIPSY